MRCPGTDKFGKQCSVFLRENEKTCWKHVVTENIVEEKKEKIVLDTRRLTTLANDEENVHTPEIQIPLKNAIYKIKSWGRSMIKERDFDLPTMIASMVEPEEVNITVDLALEHLRHCFQIKDDTKIYDVTYQELATYVWFRINYQFQHDSEKLSLLRCRFFQEVQESIGQCLNGNIARLMNVFSGIDDEMSIQVATISKDQFVTLLLENIDMLTPEMAMQRTYQLLLKAQIDDDEWGHWITAVRERKGIPLDDYSELRKSILK